MKYQILIIITVFLLILLSFHYKKYNNKSKIFDIIQIDQKVHNYKIYFTENVPIIFKNHTIDFLKKVVSPITMKSNINSRYFNEYTRHYHDLLFLQPEYECSLNILLPNQIKYFKKNKKNLQIIDKNYDYSEIQLSKDIIIAIPRFWIFKLNNNCKVSVLYTDTPFSFLFSKFS